jgi:Zn-dependent protease
MEFDLRQIVLFYITILIALTFHEFAHAWVADRLGDDTPRRAGRLTLNPFLLIKEQPMGALVFPLLGAAQGAMIGWASTPVNFARVRRGMSMRKAAFLITVAGPVANLILAVIGAAGFIALQAAAQREDLGDWGEPLLHLSFTMVAANVFLALFNLLPVRPLDGYTVLKAALPARYERYTRFLDEYSMVMFVLVLVFAGRLLSPIAQHVLLGLQELSFAIVGAP